MSKRKRKGLSKAVRFDVLKRDSFACTYCGARPPHTVLHVDHVKPVADGGGNELANLVTACEDCNLGKSDRRLMVTREHHDEVVDSVVRDFLTASDYVVYTRFTCGRGDVNTGWRLDEATRRITAAHARGVTPSCIAHVSASAESWEHWCDLLEHAWGGN